MFKIGDIVRRKIGSYFGYNCKCKRSMEKGDVDIIVGVEPTTINLKEFGNGHDRLSLELVSVKGFTMEYDAVIPTKTDVNSIYCQCSSPKIVERSYSATDKDAVFDFCTICRKEREKLAGVKIDKMNWGF